MRHMRTIVGSEPDSALIMNNDVTEIEITAQGSAFRHAGPQREGVMPFAYVVLGALAFPVVLITALASGLQLMMSALVALTLSGPVALVLYLALALTTSRGS
jgi:hypothetical protein